MSGLMDMGTIPAFLLLFSQERDMDRARVRLSAGVCVFGRGGHAHASPLPRSPRQV